MLIVLFDLKGHTTMRRCKIKSQVTACRMDLIGRALFEYRKEGKLETRQVNSINELISHLTNQIIRKVIIIQSGVRRCTATQGIT